MIENNKWECIKLSYQNFDGTIKIVVSKHICNILIIITKCMTLIDVRNKEFLKLKIKGD